MLKSLPETKNWIEMSFEQNRILFFFKIFKRGGVGLGIYPLTHTYSTLDFGVTLVSTVHTYSIRRYY